MIATSLFLCLVLLTAYAKAKGDARDIANKKHINHASGLFWSCVSVGMSGLMIVDVTGTWEYRKLMWIPMAYGLFTVSFRLMLNKRRSLNWWWMGPHGLKRKPTDSLYDTWFHGLSFRLCGVNVCPDTKDLSYPLKLPATLAYTCEVTVFIVSTIAYALTR